MFGTVVQPWKAVTDDQPAPQVEAGRFAAFDTPGYVKVAFNIRVEPYGSGRALITTETRTAATDPASLRRFARYWMLVGPFSALIRRLTLRIVKSDAERRPGLMSTTRPADRDREPGSGHNTLVRSPAGDLTPSDCRSLPTQSAGTERRAFRRRRPRRTRNGYTRTIPRDRPRYP